jgi:hypothetical protein
MESNNTQEQLKTGGFLYVIYLDLILSVLAKIQELVRSINIIKIGSLNMFAEELGIGVVVNFIISLPVSIFLFLLTLYTLVIMTDYQKRSIALLKLNYSIIMIFKLLTFLILANHDFGAIKGYDYFSFIMKLGFLIYVFKSKRVKETFVKEI